MGWRNTQIINPYSSEKNIKILDASIPGDYYLSDIDYIILCKDITRSIYLPQGKPEIIGTVYKIFNSSGIVCDIYPYSGETIIGGKYYKLLPYNSVILHLLEAGKWYII